MKAEELVEILKGEGERKEKDVAQSGIVSDECAESPSSCPALDMSWSGIAIHNHT